MKIAIFHDYFGAIGGGEKVVIEMAKILDADIITTDTDAIGKIDPSVRVISLGKTLKHPGWKQISAALKFFFCDYSKEYDLFIFSGNWAHYAAHRHHPNVWYCHILIPSLYDERIRFASSDGLGTSQLFKIWRFIHTKCDSWSIGQIDHILANSKNIQEKIFQYYNRSSDVIYPPVRTDRFYFDTPQNFWLSVNRIYPEKRIELQIESFRQIPEENLTIVGGFSSGDHASLYVQKISINIPNNITILGQISEKDLIDLYARCKGFIGTSYDEPFGIAPVEAMAAGKPVVAVDSGGFRETVTPQTGLLVNPDVSSIVSAIREISQDPARYHDACMVRARQFDIEVFQEKIRKIAKTYTLGFFLQRN